MAPLRSLSPSRGNSTDAISRFLDDNMNKWHTVDILNRTITEEEIEQVHVELPLVRALTIDRTVGFIYYNNNFHLKTLLRLLGATLLTSMMNLTMSLEAFLEHSSMEALSCFIK